MNYITAPFKWVYNQWLKFNTWLASITPGIKTKLVSFLGGVGSLAAFTQEWISGIPLSQFVTAEQALMVTALLFTLSFWFRGLSR
jgi:hypothetical protein